MDALVKIEIGGKHIIDLFFDFIRNADAVKRPLPVLHTECKRNVGDDARRLEFFRAFRSDIFGKTGRMRWLEFRCRN